jgi:predicted alpha-1,6-mannanase (GH76 family)
MTSFRGLSHMAAILLLLTSPSARPASSSLGSNDPGTSVVQQAQVAADELQKGFDPQTGLWKGEGWWNSANSLTAIVDLSLATHSSHYLADIEKTYVANRSGRFVVNKYYDDEGWWALAWIDTYDLTGDARYLQAAEGIFEDMTTGWDDTCGGGLWWTRERTYKNAIPNELFLSVAAHLANRVQDGSQRSRYLEWATREWTWLQHSTMIENDHLISDGLDAKCHDNHGTKWTYNQGVVLGGLAELSRLPGQGRVLRSAQTIGDAAIHELADRNGILHESCEPKCGGDGSQFKGIFMRNLALLNTRRPRKQYIHFIRTNAESLLKNAQLPDHSFGVVWSGPPGASDAISQTAALDALIAAIGVDSRNR